MCAHLAILGQDRKVLAGGEHQTKRGDEAHWGDVSMSASHPRIIVSVIALFAVIAAACGPTVPISEQQAAEAAAEEGLADQGLSLDDTGAPGASDTELGLGGTDTKSGAGGLTGGTTSTTGPAGSRPGTTGSSVVEPGENGPGITAKTIKIGILYTADYDEANAALGAAGASGINFRRAYDAMIEDLNKNRGGIGGRRAVPVYHKYYATSTKTSDQQDQEACAHWTQDDPVFATDGGLKTENGVACLEKAGTVAIAVNGLRFRRQRFFDAYPHYLEFDGIDNDDHSVMYADGMKKLGFFDKNMKLGLVTWDDPNYAAPMQQSLIPRLRQHGVRPADVAYIRSPESSEEVGEAVAQIGNTAVRFKGQGITHVMFLDAGGALAFFFMQAAERQQYAPRYGLTSASGNQAIADLLGEREARNQFEDAVSVGFSPTIDVRPKDVPAWGNPPSKKRCYAAMRRNGVKMDSANARALAEGVCDSVWTIEATLEAAGRVINQDTFLLGLDRVSSEDVTPTHGMGLAISRARHDGLASAAYLKFYTKCVCFRYVSDRFQVPD